MSKALAGELLTAVAATPGITTNVLCRHVRVRKSDVLAELERLREEQLLRVEPGPRGSKCWHVVPGPGNQFLTCSWRAPAASAAATSEPDNRPRLSGQIAERLRHRLVEGGGKE
jgi:hypothetical protein